MRRKQVISTGASVACLVAAAIVGLAAQHLLMGLMTCFLLGSMLGGLRIIPPALPMAPLAAAAVLAGADVLGDSLPDVFRQHHALTTFQPVQATVLGCSSGPSPGPRSLTRRLGDSVFGKDYIVVVSYRYEAGGQAYTSGREHPPRWDRLLPKVVRADLGMDTSWAGEVGPPGAREVTGNETWARETA